MIPIQDSSAKIKFPFWVTVIIALNIFIFYLEITSPNPLSLINQFALIPDQIDFSIPLTFTSFITSQFLHGGFLHIISNMWFLWIFGDNIEARFGPLFFPAFYILAGILGNFLQYIFIPQSQIPILGASGAIAGVLGAYYTFYPKNKVKTLIPILGLPAIITLPASLVLVYWFILQILSGATSMIATNNDVGGIAYFAHIGGFVTGLLIGRFFF